MKKSKKNLSHRPKTLRSNGSRKIEIRGLQGKFIFQVRQFYDIKTGKYPNWLEYMDYFEKGNYVSTNLKEYSTWLSLRCSYGQSSLILERQIGEQVLSDQSIYKIVEGKANELSKKQRADVEGEPIAEIQERIEIATDIDLYDSNTQEILLFEDGIQVKGQKNHRCSKNHPKVSDEGKKKRWITDIASLQQPDGSFLHFSNDLGNELDLSNYIRYECFRAYKDDKKPLRIVSIIDGAKTIRRHLKEAFNQEITYILDWYHLRKKCNELLSMVAFGKKHREELMKNLMAFCWKGQVEQGIEYIKNIEKVRNKTKHEELLNYLTKHKRAIIHYEKRQEAGKIIGSGQMEATVNEVIGRRQKDNGMAWSRKGSKALALLQIAHMNGQWKQIWYN